MMICTVSVLGRSGVARKLGECELTVAASVLRIGRIALIQGVHRFDG